MTRHHTRTALGVALLALGAAGPAEAATTAAVSSGNLSVSAFAGKKNVVDVSQFGGRLTVTDSGDTVTAGSGCAAVDAHTASCSATGLTGVVIHAGDLDDAITKTTWLGGLIQGGTGDDVIDAGPASTANTVYGNDGRDRLTGGPNIDRLDGGRGADVLIGGGGVDAASYRYRAAPVSATIDGLANDGVTGEGDDIRSDVEDLWGGSAPDVLVGSAAPNRLVGGASGDVLSGLGGDDTLLGGDGPDTENGGDGQDTFQQQGLDRGDVFNGGPGAADRISYADRTSPVVVDADGVADDGATGEGDNVRGDVEQMVGGHAGDTIAGSAAANLLLGGGGDDALDGLAGPDFVNGDAGDDSLLGGPGDDALVTQDGVWGNDMLDGQADSDRCTFDRFDSWANCEALAVFP